MQYLAELLGQDDEFEEDLLEVALAHATSRVVLKRRLKARLIGKPDWQIRGRSVRYDVYRGRAI